MPLIRYVQKQRSGKVGILLRHILDVGPSYSPVRYQLKAVGDYETQNSGSPFTTYSPTGQVNKEFLVWQTDQIKSRNVSSLVAVADTRGDDRGKVSPVASKATAAGRSL